MYISNIGSDQAKVSLKINLTNLLLDSIQYDYNNYSPRLVSHYQFLWAYLSGYLGHTEKDTIVFIKYW